ncbi:MAG: hypothetical protein CL760_09085 [Chloroflexi bacterium]|nr:hypothetical protein [Chloroflexota bacterium]|tara:strand:- start:35763 stop:35942 length:180 start_codon:yes stop_codon:yes gene_type:complete
MSIIEKQTTEVLQFSLTEARNHALNKDKSEQERQKAKNQAEKIALVLQERGETVSEWNV